MTTTIEPAVPCRMCNASGTCAFCAGTGTIESRQCSACSGGGRCHRCGGNGSWKRSTLRRPRSVVTGAARCTDCGGNGICTACDGTHFYASGDPCNYCEAGECATCQGDGRSPTTNAPLTHRLGGATSITYAIGSEAAPDDPIGREEVVLAADGSLRYSRRHRGERHSKVLAYSQVRFRELLTDLERSEFPRPPQRTFRPGPGPAHISILPSEAYVEIDTSIARGIDGYREFVEKLEDLVARIRTDDTSLQQDWGVLPLGSDEAPGRR